MSNEAVRAAADALQVINLILAVCLLVLSLEAARRWKAARWYAVGPGTFAVHSMVFYIAVLLSLVPAPWSSLWSAALRLHSYVFILATLVILFVVALSPEYHDDDT